MAHHRTVAVIVGSLRKESVTRKVARAIEALAPPGLTFIEVPIDDLALFNQDEEANPSPAYVEFRNRVRSADAVLFATPEYNRSVPGVLKNAVDVGSRPYGQSVWNGKPAAIVSVSPGAIGAFGANHHLRQSLVFLNMPTLQQPEAYVGNAFSLFGDNGELANETTAEFLRGFAQTFADWIEQQAPAASDRQAA
ncbi:MAG: phosphodiesterase [Phenylobacterium sp.]|nr:phosphodiesterase [Phenylobacterium sp.]